MVVVVAVASLRSTRNNSKVDNNNNNSNNPMTHPWTSVVEPMELDLAEEPCAAVVSDYLGC